jgi:iron complex transport system permease protein
MPAYSPPAGDRRPLWALPWWAICFLLAAVWLGVGALAVALGAVSVPLGTLGTVLLAGGQPSDPALSGLAAIVWQVRLPRAILGGLAGAGLAISGVAWQGVLRNPLADPYLIGASAGGALGAALAIAFGVGAGHPQAVPVLAFVGSLLAVAVVYRLAVFGVRSLAVERLLLAGVAVSSFLSALLSLALVVHSESFVLLNFWLVGGLSGRGWEQLALVTPYALAGALGVAYFTPRLNLLQLGEETAAGLGVDVVRDQRFVICFAALLTAAVVSACGMIGFVGLVVPHLARQLVGPDLRKVLPTSALLGGALLTGADLAARLVWLPVEVPVGVLTALMGAPFFLFMLARPR